MDLVCISGCLTEVDKKDLKTLVIETRDKLISYVEGGLLSSLHNDEPKFDIVFGIITAMLQIGFMKDLFTPDELEQAPLTQMHQLAFFEKFIRIFCSATGQHFSPYLPQYIVVDRDNITIAEFFYIVATAFEEYVDFTMAIETENGVYVEPTNKGIRRTRASFEDEDEMDSETDNLNDGRQDDKMEEDGNEDAKGENVDDSCVRPVHKAKYIKRNRNDCHKDEEQDDDFYYPGNANGTDGAENMEVANTEDVVEAEPFYVSPNDKNWAS